MLPTWIKISEIYREIYRASDYGSYFRSVTDQWGWGNPQMLQQAGFKPKPLSLDDYALKFHFHLAASELKYFCATSFWCSFRELALREVSETWKVHFQTGFHGDSAKRHLTTSSVIIVRASKILKVFWNANILQIILYALYSNGVHQGIEFDEHF